MCVNISNVLNSNGYDVMICSTRSGGQLEKAINPGVMYYILHKKNSLDIFAYSRLLKLVKENGVEVIHAHSSSVFWAVTIKWLLPEVKIIWHDHLGSRINDSGHNFFYRLISRKIDAIISVNSELSDWSRRNMKVPKGNIVMINNFPMLMTVDRNPNPELFTIVCLANLRPQKDHCTLIRAVALLVKQHLCKNIKVILAGSIDHSEYTSNIKSLINELGLQDIIEIRGSVEDTTSLLAFADCGILTSVSEGLPVALLEYGMAALPVVVTDAGECAEVTLNGEFGYVLPPGDYEGVAEKLRLLIENQEVSNKIGKLFRTHIMNEYGPGKFMVKYNTLLRRISIKTDSK